MLRHSFASRVLAILRGQAIGDGEVVSELDTINLRKLLLGTDRLDRRVLWAVGRLLGHKNPRITARCYLHGMESWIVPSKNDVTWNGDGPGAKMLLHLDHVSKIDGYGLQIKFERHNQKIEESQFLRLLKCCRLITQGFKFEEAVHTSRVDSTVFETFIEHASSKNSIGSEDAIDKEEAAEPKRAKFTWPISVQRFDKLIEQFATCKDVPPHECNFDLAKTLGKRRQVVLFLQEHIVAASRFITALKITEKDVALVSTKVLAPEQLKLLTSENLDRFCRSADSFGKSFQLDSAIWGPLNMRVGTRVCIVPIANSKAIHTSYEMTLLWTAWVVSMAHEKSKPGAQLQLTLPLH
jgi:hypothetical protein